MVEIVETPKHVERGGAHELPTVLCPRCRRAMAVKRIKDEVHTDSIFGKKRETKFFLNYICKDCDTEWKEEEKPEQDWTWAYVLAGVIIFVIFIIFILLLI